MLARDPRKLEIPSRKTYKLDAMRAIAGRLGHPELGRKTVLVAGTNGKGSTCAFLTALLVRHGLRVGTYSSPHVVNREERIRINGRPVASSILRMYEKRFAVYLKPLTYFERMTVLGFLIFRDQHVDIQILEVGMGGRLDATNISEPDLSLIARIDLDHQEILGKGIKKIAAEKAGIMREGRTCFVAANPSTAMSVFKRMAKQNRVDLKPCAELALHHSDRQVLQLVKSTLGSAQFENARLALSALRDLEGQMGLRPLGVKAVRQALQRQSLWPGRFQILRSKPIWIVDGAHNPNAVESLCRNLATSYAGLKFNLAFGVMAEKNVVQMVKSLRPSIREVYVTSFYPERELPPRRLMQILNKNGFKSVRRISSLSALVTRLWASSEPVLVAGSFYLVGAVLKEVEKKGFVVKDARL